MVKRITDPLSFIKTSRFIEGNPRSVNIFLVLFAISYFVVGADLCKEMAMEKKEMKFFTGILENSVSVDNSFVFRLIDTVPKESINLPSIVFSIHAADIDLFPPGRSPPELI